GVYLAKNTSQSASVEFVRFQRTNYARGRLQAFYQKRAKPFFDNSVLYTFFPEKTTWQKFAFTPYAKPEK
ncbi:MAG: hypothetical protein KH318_08715, partial [Oscillibacter sp.]|nr:hypothetical protein [Oscillibacter sp.]